MMKLIRAVHEPLEFLDSAELQIDHLLNQVCIAIQLRPELYEKARAEFETVASHLQDLRGPFAIQDPDISPQGSFETRTTVQPLRYTEYDIDLLCTLLLAHSGDYVPPAKLLHDIRGWIAQHPRLGRLLAKESPPRCIRLEYSNQFHLDIVPSCPDHDRGDGWVYVPDRTLQEWRLGNPGKFAAWFDAQADRVLEEEILLKAMRMPAAQEPVDVKPPLKRVVQLLKRWRDKQYRDDPSLAPSSILLMTAAADRYGGERSIAGTLTTILEQLNRDLSDRRPFVVKNPVDGDDLTRKWKDNPDSLALFRERVSDFQAAWARIQDGGGVHNISRILADLFGETPVQSAVRAQAELTENLRHAGNLSVDRSSGRLHSGAVLSGVAIPRNTFHGDE
jgi:hypothetical protein